jgi:hypothetical protein
MSDVEITVRTANLASTPDGSERRPGFRAAGLAAARLVRPIVAHHGGGFLPRLKSDWPAVVGAELAAATWPEALARGGTLKLRVLLAKALEIQHRTPLVIERVNLFFGRAVIERLALVQGPLPLPPPPQPEPLRPLATTEETALDRQLGGIADPELRAALDRLGRSVIGASEL